MGRILHGSRFSQNSSFLPGVGVSGFACGYTSVTQTFPATSSYVSRLYDRDTGDAFFASLDNH